jgi:transportin-3
MVEGFLRVTLPLLSEPAGLDVYPDTVDDMFRLCARMVQRCPLAFFSSPVAMTAVECAKPASLLTHREAFSSVMKFYRDLIHSPFDTSTDCDKTPILNAVNQILTHNGQIIINSTFILFIIMPSFQPLIDLVQGFVTVHSYMLAESAPVLWELLSKYKEVSHIIYSIQYHL